MSDPVDAWLSRTPYGAPTRLVPLKGELGLPGGGSAAASLAETPWGLVLAAASSASDGVAVELLSMRPLRFEDRLLGGRLVVGASAYGVPTGKGALVLELIGCARLRRAAALRQGARAASAAPPTPGPLVEAMSPVEAAWLAGWLGEGQADERLLAWLHTGELARPPSELIEATDAPLRFALSTDRATLVAVGPAGDVLLRPLPAEALTVAPRVGRDRIRAGGESWLATRGNEDRFAALARALSLRAAARVREVARVAWRLEGGADQARALLASLGEDPLALVWAWAGPGQAEAPSEGSEGLTRLNAALDRLVADPTAPDLLAEGIAGWGLPLEAAASLVAALRARGPAGAAAALPLHGRLHQGLLEREKDQFQAALLDIVYAEHCLEAGRSAAAAALLEARLALLPDEALEDLLPPADADLTAGAGGQVLRVRILELLVAARGDPTIDHPETVAALARLQPLVPERLAALAAAVQASPAAFHADAPEADLGARVRQAIAALAPGGLEKAAEPPPPIRLAPLSDELLRQRLQHPAARDGGVLGRLQGLLASVDAPDASALRAYCDRLEGAEHAPVLDALADGSLVFGMPGVAAFLSRGERKTGLRAYEGDKPFLLIGVDHLRAEGGRALSPAELRFALGAELAHLRFGHSRVTNREVWIGAWEKGKASLDVLLGALPVLKGWSFTERVATWALAPAGSVQKLFSHVGVAEATWRRLSSAFSPGAGPENPTLSARHDDLIAAARVMQLTADRAGLLLAGDLRAALRAIFLTSPDLWPELPVAARHGLARSLARRDPSGRILLQGLALRVAALLSFYLSEDYAALRCALSRAGGAPPSPAGAESATVDPGAAGGPAA